MYRRHVHIVVRNMVIAATLRVKVNGHFEIDVNIHKWSIALFILKRNMSITVDKNHHSGIRFETQI